MSTWTMARILARLGEDHVAWIRSQPDPVAECRFRAWGAWTANDLDGNAAYDALAAILGGRLKET